MNQNHLEGLLNVNCLAYSLEFQFSNSRVEPKNGAVNKLLGGAANLEPNSENPAGLYRGP